MLKALSAQICTMMSIPMVLMYPPNVLHIYVIGILSFPSCVNGTYEYIATWTNKNFIQQWMLCNVVPNMKTNGFLIFVNRILHPFGYLFGHIDVGLL